MTGELHTDFRSKNLKKSSPRLKLLRLPRDRRYLTMYIIAQCEETNAKSDFVEVAKLGEKSIRLVLFSKHRMGHISFFPLPSMFTEEMRINSLYQHTKETCAFDIVKRHDRLSS
jgi:hypothetical protein